MHWWSTATELWFTAQCLSLVDRFCVPGLQDVSVCKHLPFVPCFAHLNPLDDPCTSLKCQKSSRWGGVLNALMGTVIAM
jgi:hypothetical protein